MQYILLIYGEETKWTSQTPEQLHAMYTEYGALRDEMVKAGHYVGGNPLQLVHTATSVRVREGRRSVTDGPFAETKEQLGGYFVVEAANLDEAIDWAARIPSARLGTIEVRPIAPMRALE